MPAVFASGRGRRHLVRPQFAGARGRVVFARVLRPVGGSVWLFAASASRSSGVRTESASRTLRSPRPRHRQRLKVSVGGAAPRRSAEGVSAIDRTRRLAVPVRVFRLFRLTAGRAPARAPNARRGPHPPLALRPARGRSLPLPPTPRHFDS